LVHAGLGEKELGERLREHGVRVTVPMVRGYCAGRRLPRLEVLIEILRLCGAGFADLEAMALGVESYELKGPVPPADAAGRIGPVLGALRLDAGFSRQELTVAMRGGRRTMNVEKLARWETGRLLPPILSVVWTLQAMGRSLGELDDWLGRLGVERPFGQDFLDRG
jgi:hypothetical protein